MGWGDDPETDVVVPDLADVEDGQRFVDGAGDVTVDTPVVVLDAARVRAGQHRSNGTSSQWSRTAAVPTTTPSASRSTSSLLLKRSARGMTARGGGGREQDTVTHSESMTASLRHHPTATRGIQPVDGIG
jgi:hypothetical protein